MGLLWNRANYGLHDVGPPADDIDALFGVIPRLEPVLRAEQLRGNEPVGRWHAIRGQVVGEFWHELVLRFPHDQDAIRAEFDFDDRSMSLAGWLKTDLAIRGTASIGLNTMLPGIVKILFAGGVTSYAAHGIGR